MKDFKELFNGLPQVVQYKLNSLKRLRERPDYHPEGSTYEHVRIVAERALKWGNIDLVCVAIFHDICKLDTVKLNPKTGLPTSPGHEFAAVQWVSNTPEALDWILSIGGDLKRVLAICENHMKIHQLEVMRPNKRDRYISTWKDLGIYEDLVVFGRMDNMLKEF